MNAHAHGEVVRPRQVAMYLAHRLTVRSLPEIGRDFGGRDHTTVMHAVRVFPGYMDRDRDLARRVMKLETQLTADLQGEILARDSLEQGINEACERARRHLILQARRDPVSFIQKALRL